MFTGVNCIALFIVFVSTQPTNKSRPGSKSNSTTWSHMHLQQVTKRYFFWMKLQKQQFWRHCHTLNSAGSHRRLTSAHWAVSSRLHIWSQGSRQHFCPSACWIASLCLALATWGIRGLERNGFNKRRPLAVVLSEKKLAVWLLFSQTQSCWHSWLVDLKKKKRKEHRTQEWTKTPALLLIEELIP